MFLMQRSTGDLIRVESIEELCDPLSDCLHGRDQAGEEEQETQSYNKEDLAFPSGEPLPQCWTEAQYRIERPQRAK